jgi:putative ABC transport system substrate-binding protein
MVRRRHQLRIVCALALAGALPWIGIATAGAAAHGKTVRVGLLLSGFEPSYVTAERAFLAGMRELGYEEGKNLVVERRYAHLEPDRMRLAAAELAQLNLDAVLTGCTGSTRAMQRATQTTPIVMASVADPVGQGFVKRLARSGTNVTGRSSQSLDLMPKMLELFTTALPGATRIAVLVNVLNTVHETLWTRTVAATAAREIDLVRVDVRGPAGLDTAFETLSQSRAHALLVLPDDPMSYNHRGRIVEFARMRGLPTFFGQREFVDAGGLMSYGEKFADTYRYTAPYFDQVVRGASPAELPIEQPTRFELVINLKTAAALDLVFPRSVLLRADATVK